MVSETALSGAINGFEDYRAAGNDVVSAQVNAQIASRFAANTQAYFKSFGRLPNYLEPRGYSEKIQWRKIFDRNPLFPVFCDKLAASAFARSRSPVVRSAEVYWSGDDPEAMPLEILPPPFVVKASNRSQAVVLVSSARELDAARIRSQCRAWLGSRPYGAALLEWAYAKSAPKIMIEEFVTSSPEPQAAVDFKIHVFDGRARMVFYCDRARNQRGMFTPEWQPLNLDRWLWGHLDVFTADVPPPPNLARMIAAAEELAEGIDYVRVDLYNREGEIFFGELSPFSYSGFAYWVPKGTVCNPFPPRDMDDEFGEAWQLPDIPWDVRIRRALNE